MSQEVAGLEEPHGPATVQTTAEQIGAAAGDKAARENFPVALRLLPARYRRHLQAVYGYARAVDDMGDEAPPGQRARLLDDLEADLGRLYRFQGSDPGEPPRLGVVRALAPVVAECGVPRQPFLDLIQANRQDQIVSRYATFDDLVRLLRAVGQPGGPDRAVRVRRGQPGRGWCCPTRCAPRCSWPSTGRTWPRITGPAGSTCPPRTWTGSGSAEADLAAPTAGRSSGS